MTLPLYWKTWKLEYPKGEADSTVKMVVKDTVVKPPLSRNTHVFFKPWSFLLHLLLVGFAWARGFRYLVILEAWVAPSFHSWWGCQFGHLFYCLGSVSFSAFSFPFFEALPLETGLPMASHLPSQCFLLFCPLQISAFNVPFKWAIATQTFGILVCLHCTLAGICGNILACSCACKWSE